ncbi:hypothetical protein NEUTE2DRAFT_106312 [Neurospora tetrasperma FGSC 2509]|nr:hypothetical protein NEUTE2DRAFT_106312 [Neurospora tetrasperma FGSC 2509]
MSYSSRQPDLGSKTVSPKRSLTDIRSKAVSPDRWRDPGLLFQRDSESSMGSSDHSTPTNGSPQIRATIFEPFNRVFSPYSESSAAFSPPLFPLPEVPDTPTSTLGQFGDLVQQNIPQNPSATELVQKVYQSWSSQSRDGQSETHHSQSHSRTRSRHHHSQSRSRSEQRQGREGQDLREVLESPASRQPSLRRSATQQSFDTRDNRERSHSRSTLQAAAQATREAHERIQHTTAKERNGDRERARERDRSQSTHRRGASANKLRLLAHERSYDNDREIATDKVNRFLQSLEPSKQAFMTFQTAESPTPQAIPRFAASETSQSMVSQQTPVLTRPQTPQSMVSQPTQFTPTQNQTVDHEKELMLENRGLYQRVAALQRTERDLLAENQDLVRQLAILKKHHETRREQWQDELQSVKEREKMLLAEAQQLKAQTMRQEKQIIDLTISSSQLAPALEPTPGLLSNQEIKAWFAERDETWYAWARDYASKDPNRLLTGLHPLQLHELCDGVKDFVKITDDHKLPSELLVGSTEMVQTLLHSILANFICSEALSSPFWVFNAISSGTPESPYMAPTTAISPGGFHFDFSMSNAIPSRNLYVPSAQNARKPLSLLTTNLPLNHHHDPISASSLAYPMKAEMENMFHMLTKDPTSSTSPAHVQASLVHLFATAGISLPSSSTSSSSSSANGIEAKRMLIESRLNYARRLKDRFLSGVARFLLQDQDPAGIVRLERSLTEHIDDALRFSCQFWARPGPIRFHAGFAALGGQVYKAGGRLVELCWAQQQGLERTMAGQTPQPPGNDDGKQVLMVVQPAVESLKIGSGGDDDIDTKPSKTSKVWLKARVLVGHGTPAPQIPVPTAQGQLMSISHARSNTSSSIIGTGGAAELHVMTRSTTMSEKSTSVAGKVGLRDEACNAQWDGLKMAWS